jgi:16S rRNA (uracil1498-N3)-methyltransferase
VRVRPHRAYSPGLTGVLPLEEGRHLVEVLRAGVGDRFTVFDESREALAEVVDLGPPVRYRILEERRPEREVGVEVVLYVALLKGDKLSEVVRAATELGATRIQPLITRHSVPKEMGEGKLRRLKAIAKEAAKQSGRLRVPEVLPPIPLKAVPEVEQGLVAHVGAKALVREVLDPNRNLSLAVGPEGGFAEEEVALLEERGFAPVSLGRRILRAETAATALLAIVTAGEGR